MKGDLTNHLKPCGSMITKMMLYFVVMTSTVIIPFYSAQAQTIFGLTEKSLVSFRSDRPDSILMQLPITGVAQGQDLVGMDFRPATKQLYALGYNNTNGEASLYTIDKNSGAASCVGGCLFLLPMGIEQLTIDFNPVVDRIRLLGSNGSNYRLHPDTGGIVAQDGELKFASGDENEGMNPKIGAGSYTNSFPGTTGTTLFNYDIERNIVVSQVPPNDGILNTIGASGIILNPMMPIVDMDIYFNHISDENTCFLAAYPAGSMNPVLYRVNLNDGSTWMMGQINLQETLYRIAVELDEPKAFIARLSARKEALPIASHGSGVVMAKLVGDMLRVWGEFDGLSTPLDVNIAGGAHIHKGYAGQNGPVELVLAVSAGNSPNGGLFVGNSNIYQLNEEQIASLNDRALYVNIHSEMFHSGEIRGQLLPSGSEYYYSNLFGSNEVPSIISDAMGALAIELSGDTLTISGSFNNLEGDFDEEIAGGAHIHMGLAGSNGGIAIHLHPDVDLEKRSGTFRPEENQWVLSNEQTEALRNRMLYANIHTKFNAAGEIRGQILGDADVVYRAYLAGINEYPFVTSMGKGQILAEVRDSLLMITGVFESLESPIDPNVAGGVHLHIGKAGINGGILLHLHPTLDAGGTAGIFEIAENTFVITEEEKKLFLDRSVYLNLHTTEIQSGELRGQLLPECQYVMNAILTGSQEIPRVISRAYGAAKAEVNGDYVIVTGSFTGLESDLDESIAGGVHLHAGLPGTNGGIVSLLVPRFDDNKMNGTFEGHQNMIKLTAQEKQLLRDRAIYINIHTLGHGHGEIRGNLLGEAATYFMSPLGGASESTAVNTEANGFAVLEVNDDQIQIIGSFDLESEFDINIAGGAHIHSGYAGQDGGIVSKIHVEVSGDLLSGRVFADENKMAASSSFIDSLRNRQFYINIHTSENPSGEIRGQILPAAQSYFHTTLSGMNEVPPVISPANGSIKYELVANRIMASGSFNGLVGELDKNIAGGIHVHSGKNGVNGGIELHLHTELDTDLKSGVIDADRNTFTLTSDQMNKLFWKELYANLHTTEFPSGELRGQILMDVNFFPSMAEITIPENGSNVFIKEIMEDSVQIRWEQPMDIDGDDITYIWMASLEESFENVLAAVYTGDETFLNIDKMDLANLLDKDTTILYHRVVSSDGSNSSVGLIFNATFMKDSVNSAFDFFREDSRFSVVPNVSSGTEVNVILESDQNSKVELSILHQSGMLIQHNSMNLEGGKLIYPLDVSRLQPGVYFVNVRTDKGILPVQKFIIQ